MADSGMAPER